MVKLFCCNTDDAASKWCKIYPPPSLSLSLSVPPPSTSSPLPSPPHPPLLPHTPSLPLSLPFTLPFPSPPPLPSYSSLSYPLLLSFPRHFPILHLPLPLLPLLSLIHLASAGPSSESAACHCPWRWVQGLSQPAMGQLTRTHHRSLLCLPDETPSQLLHRERRREKEGEMKRRWWSEGGREA